MKLFQQIENLRDLPENWDSYGSAKIHPRAINMATAMIHTLPVLAGGWQAVPCSDGGVQLEHHGDGFDIEITIRNSERTGG